MENSLLFQSMGTERIRSWDYGRQPLCYGLLRRTAQIAVMAKLNNARLQGSGMVETTMSSMTADAWLDPLPRPPKNSRSGFVFETVLAPAQLVPATWPIVLNSTVVGPAPTDHSIRAPVELPTDTLTLSAFALFVAAANAA